MIGIARSQTLGEPAYTLLRPSMIETVGHLTPVSLALEVVVADLGSGIYGILHITFLERIKHLIVEGGPYSGVEIGL